MAVNTYKLIKNQNGEKFAQTLSNHHSGILELPNIVKILEHAGRGAEDAKKLLPYLTSLIGAKEAIQVAATLDPFELLGRAGYDAFVADTLEKQNSIRQYFTRGELLCTFNSASRYQQYHIIHAVKKNVKDIKRGDYFSNKSRQDDYGTSVISIQILKTGGFIKITNRWNHSITNPDNTFDSNPDNIIEGLSEALKQYFCVDFTANKFSLPCGFLMVGQQILKYDYEKNNIYYGDQVWVSQGRIHTACRKNGDALYEGFYFDNKTKTMRAIDPQSKDSFPEVFNRYYGGDKNLYVRNDNLMLGDEILIEARNSKIIKLFMNRLTKLSDRFLFTAKSLIEIYLDNVETINNGCFYNVENLTTISMPKLQSIASHCFHDAQSLSHLHMPMLETIGSECFNNTRLEEIELNNLRTIGRYNFRNLNVLKVLKMNNLLSMGDECFNEIRSLNSLSMESLEKMGNKCFEISLNLFDVSVNKLKVMGNNCFYNVPNLFSLSMDSLHHIGNNCFYAVDSLRKISMPSLQSMRNNCFVKSRQVEEGNFPLLMQLGSQTFTKSPSYMQFVAPKLLKIPRHLRPIILKNPTNQNPRRHLLQT